MQRWKGGRGTLRGNRVTTTKLSGLTRIINHRGEKALDPDRSRFSCGSTLTTGLTGENTLPGQSICSSSITNRNRTGFIGRQRGKTRVFVESLIKLRSPTKLGMLAGSRGPMNILPMFVARRSQKVRTEESILRDFSFLLRRDGVGKSFARRMMIAIGMSDS